MYLILKKKSYSVINNAKIKSFPASINLVNRFGYLGGIDFGEGLDNVEDSAGDFLLAEVVVVRRHPSSRAESRSVG